MFIEDLFINILSMSTIASIVFLVILLARRLLRNTVSVRKLSLLWIIFVLILIIPINFKSKLSIKNLIDDTSKLSINMQNAYNISEDTFLLTNTEPKVNSTR